MRRNVFVSEQEIAKVSDFLREQKVTDDIESRRDLMRQEILDRVFRIIKNQDLGSWEDKGEIYDGIIKKFSKE